MKLAQYCALKLSLEYSVHAGDALDQKYLNSKSRERREYTRNKDSKRAGQRSRCIRLNGCLHRLQNNHALDHNEQKIKMHLYFTVMYFSCIEKRSSVDTLREQIALRVRVRWAFPKPFHLSTSVRRSDRWHTIKCVLPPSDKCCPSALTVARVYLLSVPYFFCIRCYCTHTSWLCTPGCTCIYLQWYILYP